MTPPVTRSKAHNRRHPDANRGAIAGYQRTRAVQRLIAWASGNALFGYLVESLLGIVDGAVIGMDYPPARRKLIVAAHQEIFDALQKRDPDAAEQGMRDHLAGYVRYAEKRYPDLFGRVIPWARATPR